MRRRRRGEDEEEYLDKSISSVADHNYRRLAARHGGTAGQEQAQKWSNQLVLPETLVETGHASRIIECPADHFDTSFLPALPLLSGAVVGAHGHGQ